MKQNAIYSIAVECKPIVDEELEFYHNTKSGKFIPGNNSPLNKALQMLCDAIKDNYPSEYIMLQNCMDKYDAHSMETINKVLDHIIDVESAKTMKRDGSTKLFISHSSSDFTIVKAFVDNILKFGCGFQNNEIFCTIDSTAIPTGTDIESEILSNIECCDYFICLISENYKKSDVCQNELGMAKAFKKIILPFKFPNISYENVGFLTKTKQVADITDKSKLDELYKELCNRYDIEQDWLSFNQNKEDFIKTINETLVKG